MPPNQMCTKTHGMAVCCLSFTCSCPLFFQVSVRAGSIGVGFAIGYLISFYNTTWQYFGWYLMVLSFFHFSEYFVTALINPRSLSLDSFLLNHSIEYGVAVVAGIAEFIVELLIFPGM